MRWATRRGCHVDRTACAWLVRRFVDPGAEFYFFEDLAEAPEGAELFDVAGARLSHQGDDCSFETFLKEYENLSGDPVLGEISEIVHDATFWMIVTGGPRRRVWTLSSGVCSSCCPTTTPSSATPAPFSTGSTRT